MHSKIYRDVDSFNIKFHLLLRYFFTLPQFLSHFALHPASKSTVIFFLRLVTVSSKAQVCHMIAHSIYNPHKMLTQISTEFHFMRRFKKCRYDFNFWLLVLLPNWHFINPSIKKITQKQPVPFKQKLIQFSISVKFNTAGTSLDNNS